MNFPLATYIGLRYTGTRKRSQLVSFLSGISISGLVVGVALLLVVLSVMNGFERELRERILGLVPQASIMHYNNIENWPALVDELKKDPRVVAAAPYVQIPALASYRKNAEPVVLYGIEPEYEKRVSIITQYLDEQTLNRLSEEPNAIIIGSGVAAKLKVAVGGKLMLVIPGNTTGNSVVGNRAASQFKYFDVIAIVDSKTQLDNVLGLTGLKAASNLAGLKGRVTGVRLKLDDLFNAPSVVYENTMRLGVGYHGTNWTRTQGNLYQGIQMSKNLVGLVMSLIVAIAAFNVVSTLVMVVVDKQGEIAILRTLGASTKTILSIFVVQGTFIGLLGTLLGVGVGVVLSLVVQDFVHLVEALFHVQFLKSDVYPITYVPSEIRLGDVLTVGLTALGLSFLATLYPAWKASRIQPADALRYE